MDTNHKLPTVSFSSLLVFRAYVYPIGKKFVKLNAALVDLVEDYSLVTFYPLSVQV